MSKATVYLLILAGESGAAQRFVNQRYPGHPIKLVSKRHLREGGWRTKIREIRAMRGEALVIFSGSLFELREPLLFQCTGFAHRCRETVLADAEGRSRTYTRSRLLCSLPKIILSGLLDFLVLALMWIGARALLHSLARRTEFRPCVEGDLDIALLDPAFEPANSGGAMSYLDGTLFGWSQESVSCEIFSGRQLPVGHYPVEVIPSRRRLYLFRECQALAYNLRFAMCVWRKFRGRMPLVLYQRHGRFAFSGALLSWLSGKPLILEYQGSEVWMADNWDPARFRFWLKLCEDVSIAASSQMVVLSDVLRDELIARGYPAAKIIVNPAAVNPDRFRPDCGGREIRQQLGLLPQHALVTFVGSFSYYHGISVLARAITTLLQKHKEGPVLANLRFMLVGDGLLRPETEEALSRVEGSQAVIFTGLVPHASIPSYLDASDILVSPQVPNPDGKPFFGSPTKLFEYMAMEKAIVASNMDQLASVLSHANTAWMVTPGSDTELANAIEHLATRSELRRLLGRNARATALQRHTWHQNAVRLISQTGLSREPAQPEGVRSIYPASQSDDLSFETTREHH